MKRFPPSERSSVISLGTPVVRQVVLAAVVVLISMGVGVSAALATSGDYHSGGANPGAQFCAPGSGSCDAKTRDGNAPWFHGYYGYTGAWRPGVGWQALIDNGSGYGAWSTYTDVEAICGNDSNVTYIITCWTDNL
jgi:hypothetical protein